MSHVFAGGSNPSQQGIAVLSYEAPTTSRHGYGLCPSGTMTTRYSNGFIEIHYNIPSAVQKPYHPRPGWVHSGDDRVAYLPNSCYGHQILVRYQYAFLHGHSFSVGRSATSGLDNQVTWSPYVPHKTSRQGGGQFGFPDNNYVSVAGRAMDALGVPQDALTCRQWILQQQRQQQQQQRQQQQLQGYRTAGHDLSVVRQETIYYMAPLQWNASDQFSKYLETVSAPPGNSRLEKQGVNQQPHPQSSLARAAAALSPSSLPGNLSNGNWLSSGNWVSSFAPSGTIVYPGNTCNAPISFNNQHLQSVSNVTAQDPTNQTESAAADGKGEDDECPICLDVLFDLENTLSQSHSVVRLKSCKHLFHRQCILDSLNQHHDKCPSCRDPIGVEPNGKGPSGSMTITLDKVRPCPGFSDSDGVISIYYNMPMGVQAPYMEHPGQRYSGTARQAYLPHNTEGRRLLNRLRYAFRHGLCFRVGTSLTTGLPNQITWTSIHHKTSLHGGVHGFPDPNYMKNCNDSLDALHVPAAEDCS